MDQVTPDLARIHFIVHSVLIGTMDSEALVDALEILDGILGEVPTDAQADVAEPVAEAAV